MKTIPKWEHIHDMYPTNWNKEPFQFIVGARGQCKRSYMERLFDGGYAKPFKIEGDKKDGKQ